MTPGRQFLVPCLSSLLVAVVLLVCPGLPGLVPVALMALLVVIWSAAVQSWHAHLASLRLARTRLAQHEIEREARRHEREQW